MVDVKAEPELRHVASGAVFKVGVSHKLPDGRFAVKDHTGNYKHPDGGYCYNDNGTMRWMDGEEVK